MINHHSYGASDARLAGYALIEGKHSGTSNVVCGGGGMGAKGLFNVNWTVGVVPAVARPLRGGACFTSL